MGFKRIYRYTAGTADWFSSGLPRGGTPEKPTVAPLVRREVPTCAPDDMVETVQKPCLVVNNRGVVLGRVPKSAGSGPARAGMTSVRTWRPDATMEDVLNGLRDANIDQAVITTNDGTLYGVVRRGDLERELSTTRR